MPVIVNAEFVIKLLGLQAKTRRPKGTQAYSRTNLPVRRHQHLWQMQLAGGCRARGCMYALRRASFQHKTSRISCESLQQRASIHRALLYTSLQSLQDRRLRREGGK